LNKQEQRKHRARDTELQKAQKSEARKQSRDAKKAADAEERAEQRALAKAERAEIRAQRREEAKTTRAAEAKSRAERDVDVDMHSLPTAEDMQEAEINPAAAILKMWEMTGHDWFGDLTWITELAQTPAEKWTPDQNQKVKDMADRIRAAGPTLTDQVDIHDKWLYGAQGLSVRKDMKACMTCGQRILNQAPFYQWHRLNNITCMEFSKQDEIDLAAIDEQWHPLISMFRDPNTGTRYFVHPEFVVVDRESDPDHPKYGGLACSSCSTHLNINERPPRSVAPAKGKHFADRMDLGHSHRFAKVGLKPLTVIEKMLIAPVRLFGTCVQLVPPPQYDTQLKWKKHHVLTGHNIAFMHNGPEAAAAASKNIETLPNVDDVFHFKVIFMGACKGKLRLHNFADLPDLMVRFDNVIAWLTMLKALHPQYRNIDIDDSAVMNKRVEELVRNLANADNAMFVDSETHVKLHHLVVSDVNAIRNIANCKVDDEGNPVSDPDEWDIDYDNGLIRFEWPNPDLPETSSCHADSEDSDSPKFVYADKSNVFLGNKRDHTDGTTVAHHIADIAKTLFPNKPPLDDLPVRTHVRDPVQQCTPPRHLQHSEVDCPGDFQKMFRGGQSSGWSWRCLHCKAEAKLDQEFSSDEDMRSHQLATKVHEEWSDSECELDDVLAPSNFEHTASSCFTFEESSDGNDYDKRRDSYRQGSPSPDLSNDEDLDAELVERYGEPSTSRPGLGGGGHTPKHSPSETSDDDMKDAQHSSRESSDAEIMMERIQRTLSHHDDCVDGMIGAAADADHVHLRPDTPEEPEAATPAKRTNAPVITAKPSLSKPLNEFENNDTLFHGALPWCFPFGAGIPTKGSIPPTTRLHLLRQFSNTCAREPWFLFLSMNQMQRHAVARRTATIKAHPNSFAEFAQWMRVPANEKLLEAAQADPKGKDAQTLMKKVKPFLRMCGGRVPFSEQERNAGISHMHAMCHSLGPPTHFLTYDLSF